MKIFDYYLKNILSALEKNVVILREMQLIECMLNFVCNRE